jgi:hypothetical protein
MMRTCAPAATSITWLPSFLDRLQIAMQLSSRVIVLVYAIPSSSVVQPGLLQRQGQGAVAALTTAPQHTLAGSPTTDPLAPVPHLNLIGSRTSSSVVQPGLLQRRGPGAVAALTTAPQHTLAGSPTTGPLAPLPHLNLIGSRTSSSVVQPGLLQRQGAGRCRSAVSLDNQAHTSARGALLGLRAAVQQAGVATAHASCKGSGAARKCCSAGQGGAARAATQVAVPVAWPA